MPFEYPKSEEEARGTPFEQTHALHGAGDPEALFRGAPKTVAPWPSAGRTKTGPGYDRAAVQAALQNPDHPVRHVDPRYLHASQPWVTRAGVDYYMTPEYERTGETFADQNDPGNQRPVVVRDVAGRNRLLSGHHRAVSALLKGKQFRALYVGDED
jgi:hypothetical protein